MNRKISRRQVITRSGACLGAGIATTMAVTSQGAEAHEYSEQEPFPYCLNMATIRGKKLSVVEEVEVAAKAGYQGVELWVDNIARHVESGGSFGDLKQRIADLGLTVVSAIGFPRWIVDDDAQRAEGLEQMRRGMDLVAQIGGKHIAAPPAGAHGTPNMDLKKIAERYHAVLELGREMGVVPQLEIWGSSKTLGPLGEAAYVVVEARHPDACLLLDAYHIYRSGSSFTGLKLLNGAAMHNFHINDYPADPPREQLNDGHRVYPGDGVCPLPSILRDLHATGFRGAISLELFNREYWQHDALSIARTGLQKTRAVVRSAFA
jgi:sugar phosphate isomerase/epimerase